MMRREWAVLTLCSFLALVAGACSSKSQKLDEHRSKLNSEIGAQLFDKQVREFWSLGMTRGQVETAAFEARVRMRPTQDARALREIDPAYDDRPAMVARIIPSGVFFDSKYFETSEKVGWLYFFFDESDHLRLVSYRLTMEQERAAKQTVRVIMPAEAGS